MARTVHCVYLDQEAPGLDFQLYPGELGKRIFNEISKEAWGLWQSKQTMLINEKKLNMMNPEHRKFLEGEMERFLFKGEDVEIEGYTPPAQGSRRVAFCALTGRASPFNEHPLPR